MRPARFHRLLDDRVTQVVELAEEWVDLAHRADVEEREDTTLEGFDDVATEAREGVRTGRPASTIVVAPRARSLGPGAMDRSATPQ